MKLITPVFGEDEVAMVRQCLASGWVTQSPFVRRFEELFATRHNVPHAPACTSCTTALHLAVMALGIGPGDDVLVPAFTWITTANVVEYVGARPIFVDVNPATFNMDPQKAACAVTPQTKAIIPVHLFGLAAPMKELLALAQQHGLYVIGDAACAVGTEYDGQNVAGLGAAACYSFHPRKAITTGEGGMVTTCDATLAGRVAVLRNHGALARPPVDAGKPWAMGEFDDLGYNFRMCDIQAAVGVPQMGRLDALLAERSALATRYNALLAHYEEILTPTIPVLCGHTYQSYVIRVRNGGKALRNGLMAALEAEGIQSKPGPHAVHRLGYYQNKYAFAPDDFPLAVLCEDTSIALPMFHGMQEEAQRTVCRCLEKHLTGIKS